MIKKNLISPHSELLPHSRLGIGKLINPERALGYCWNHCSYLSWQSTGAIIDSTRQRISCHIPETPSEIGTTLKTELVPAFLEKYVFSSNCQIHPQTAITDLKPLGYSIPSWWFGCFICKINIFRLYLMNDFICVYIYIYIIYIK